MRTVAYLSPLTSYCMLGETPLHTAGLGMQSKVDRTCGSYQLKPHHLVTSTVGLRVVILVGLNGGYRSGSQLLPKWLGLKVNCLKEFHGVYYD